MEWIDAAIARQWQTHFDAMSKQERAKGTLESGVYHVVHAKAT